MLVRLLQERPAVGDVEVDARIGIRMIGVQLAAEFSDARVDLDRVDIVCPVA
jgi:hypothetical protein